MAANLTRWLVENTKQYGKDRGPDFAHELVAESVSQKKYDPRKFSLLECAKACFGESWESKLKRTAHKRQCVEELTFESQDAVDASTFQAVTGSVMVEKMESSYAAVMSNLDGVVKTIPTPNNFDVMTQAAGAKATDKPSDIAPAQPYPKTGLGYYTITLPAPIKTGLIGQVTLEAIRADATLQILDMFGEVSEQVALVEKKRKLKVILGIDNTFKRNGTSYNTYLSSGAWTNSTDTFDQGNGPEEFSELDAMFEDAVDPLTGEVIEINQSKLKIFVPQANLVRTTKNKAATEIETTVSGVTVKTANPMALPDIIADRMAKKLLVDAGLTSAQASTYVIYGDLYNAFGWREVEPFHALEREGELASDIGWEQDIVYAAKARIWGVAVTLNPLLVTRGRKMA